MAGLKRHPPGYELLGLLGRGGSGEVFKATQLSLERLVAIKISIPGIPGSTLTDPERMMNEAKTLAALKHRHIIDVIDVFMWDGRICIVMEYLEGMTLEDLLMVDPSDSTVPDNFRNLLHSKGRLTLKALVETTREVADALDHAHDKNLVHRDIKPSNIFITNDLSIKLFDFGISRSAGSSGMTEDGKTLGSPPYMSPEQIQRKPEELDRRSDIYSLGCVLFHCTTGELPFSDTTSIMVCFKHINQTPPNPADLAPYIPVPINDLILRCLAKSPEDRFQTASELIRALPNGDIFSPSSEEDSTANYSNHTVTMEQEVPTPEARNGNRLLLLTILFVVFLLIITTGGILGLQLGIIPADMVKEIPVLKDFAPKEEMETTSIPTVEKNTDQHSSEESDQGSDQGNEPPNDPEPQQQPTPDPTEPVPMTPVKAEQPKLPPNLIKLNDYAARSHAAGLLLTTQTVQLIETSKGHRIDRINLAVANQSNEDISVSLVVEKGTATVYTMNNQLRIREYEINIADLAYGEAFSKEDLLNLQPDSNGLFPLITYEYLKGKVEEQEKAMTATSSANRGMTRSLGSTNSNGAAPTKGLDDVMLLLADIRIDKASVASVRSKALQPSTSQQSAATALPLDRIQVSAAGLMNSDDWESDSALSSRISNGLPRLRKKSHQVFVFDEARRVRAFLEYTHLVLKNRGKIVDLSITQLEPEVATSGEIGLKIKDQTGNISGRGRVVTLLAYCLDGSLTSTAISDRAGWSTATVNISGHLGISQGQFIGRSVKLPVFSSLLSQERNKNLSFPLYREDEISELVKYGRARNAEASLDQVLFTVVYTESPNDATERGMQKSLIPSFSPRFNLKARN